MEFDETLPNMYKFVELIRIDSKAPFITIVKNMEPSNFQSKTCEIDHQSQLAKNQSTT